MQLRQLLLSNSVLSVFKLFGDLELILEVESISFKLHNVRFIEVYHLNQVASLIFRNDEKIIGFSDIHRQDLLMLLLLRNHDVMNMLPVENIVDHQVVAFEGVAQIRPAERQGVDGFYLVTFYHGLFHSKTIINIPNLLHSLLFDGGTFYRFLYYQLGPFNLAIFNHV